MGILVNKKIFQKVQVSKLYIALFIDTITKCITEIQIQAYNKANQ